MARFKLNGEVLPSPDHIRVREMCEAEKALEINADETGMAGKMALAFYVALRRKDPERSPALIADEVLDVDMSAIEEVEDEAVDPTPPVEEGGQEPESPPIFGPQRLEASG